MHFLPVFELMLYSLLTIQIELHQYPWHQSILLTQGPIHEIFTNFFCEFGIFEKLSFFESTILDFFFGFFFVWLYPHENQSKLLGNQDGVEILMLTLVSSKFLAMRNNTLYSVCLFVYRIKENTQENGCQDLLHTGTAVHKTITTNNNNIKHFFLQYIRMEIDTTQVVSLSGFQKLSIPIVLLFSSTYY